MQRGLQERRRFVLRRRDFPIGAASSVGESAPASPSARRVSRSGRRLLGGSFRTCRGASAVSGREGSEDYSCRQKLILRRTGNCCSCQFQPAICITNLQWKLEENLIEMDFFSLLLLNFRDWRFGFLVSCGLFIVESGTIFRANSIQKFWFYSCKVSFWNALHGNADRVCSVNLSYFEFGVQFCQCNMLISSLKLLKGVILKQSHEVIKELRNQIGCLENSMFNF